MGSSDRLGPEIASLTKLLSPRDGSVGPASVGLGAVEPTSGERAHSETDMSIHTTPRSMYNPPNTPRTWLE